MTTDTAKEKLIVILGPTATGKSQLAIHIAQVLKTGIVSGDSMLVYRGLDIGSAKPAEAERGGVPHALMDILNPTDSSFSVSEFQRLASAEIHAANQVNRVPVLAGGTGLYIKALLEGYCFSREQGNDDYRVHLEGLAQQYGNEYVHRMLEEADPETAERLHANDLRRVIRALEVWHLGKERISQLRQEDTLVYDAYVIGLQCERSLLYDRIEKRVDQMIAKGLEEEVRLLLHSGVSRNARAMQGIGYKEMAAYIEGECSFEAAVDNIKKATRHFAKRQFTWYRKMPYIRWFDIDKLSFGDMSAIIFEEIEGKFGLKMNR